MKPAVFLALLALACVQTASAQDLVSLGSLQGVEGSGGWGVGRSLVAAEAPTEPASGRSIGRLALMKAY